MYGFIVNEKLKCTWKGVSYQWMGIREEIRLMVSISGKVRQYSEWKMQERKIKSARWHEWDGGKRQINPTTELREMKEEENVESAWNRIKWIILPSAAEVCGVPLNEKHEKGWRERGCGGKKVNKRKIKRKTLHNVYREESSNVSKNGAEINTIILRAKGGKKWQKENGKSWENVEKCMANRWYNWAWFVMVPLSICVTCMWRQCVCLIKWIMPVLFSYSKEKIATVNASVCVCMYI